MTGATSEVVRGIDLALLRSFVEQPPLTRAVRNDVRALSQAATARR